MQLIQMLEAFRKTNSKSATARELKTYQQNQQFLEKWEKLQRKELIKLENKKYVLTQKGVKRLAKHYKKNRQ